MFLLESLEVNFGLVYFFLPLSLLLFYSLSLVNSTELSTILTLFCTDCPFVVSSNCDVCSWNVLLFLDCICVVSTTCCARIYWYGYNIMPSSKVP